MAEHDDLPAPSEGAVDDVCGELRTLWLEPREITSALIVSAATFLKAHGWTRARFVESCGALWDRAEVRPGRRYDE